MGLWGRVSGMRFQPTGWMFGLEGPAPAYLMRAYPNAEAPYYRTLSPLTVRVLNFQSALSPPYTTASCSFMRQTLACGARERNRGDVTRGAEGQGGGGQGRDARVDIVLGATLGHGRGHVTRGAWRQGVKDARAGHVGFGATGMNTSQDRGAAGLPAWQD